jgi:hypothetical membrane protein
LDGMKREYSLLAGPLGSFVFGLSVILLPLLIPGYSQIRQTVSEIGMLGSPMRIPFTIMLCVVALCMLVFGYGLHGAAIRAGHSPVAAYLTACMSVSAAGAGVFAYPAAPHNYFGLSELIAYEAPVALAITWRRDPRAAGVVRFSWIMSVLMWAAIALNLQYLSARSHGGALWAHERSIYGLVQRSLFTVFFSWCGAIGVMLFAARRHTFRPGHAAID